MRLTRRGLRLVPENFAMMFVLVCWCVIESGQGTRVDERRRFERQAVRPFTPEKNARPSQLTGAWSRPENPSGGGHCPVLCRLSYVPKDGGTRTRNPMDQEGTPVCATGRLEFQGARQLQRHRRGCEARARTWSSWFRARCGSAFHHLALRSGRRDSNSQPPASEAGALPLRHVQVFARVVLTAGFEPALTAF